VDSLVLLHLGVIRFPLKVVGRNPRPDPQLAHNHFFVQIALNSYQNLYAAPLTLDLRSPFFLVGKRPLSGYSIEFNSPSHSLHKHFFGVAVFASILPVSLVVCLLCNISVLSHIHFIRVVNILNGSPAIRKEFKEQVVCPSISKSDW
jgi:hypothetical protein